MTTWIFQGNPSIFDFAAYLQSTPGAITWLVESDATEMRCGDSVFLWRSEGVGGNASDAGVVAYAEIISDVSLMPEEPESVQFWRDTSKLGIAQSRVWLKIIRAAKSKEVLKQEWLREDTQLKTMLVLKQAVGENSKLTQIEADRLQKMWSRVGQNWNRSESIAGLWAYVETYGKAVSRLAGSPVDKVSVLTGRAISGVYNKVMNFRSIDPRDPRKGMSGAGQMDRAVWPEFFDVTTQTLDDAAIRAEFDRLWGTLPAAAIDVYADQRAESEVFGAEVEKLLNRSLASLMTAYNRQRQQPKARSDGKPKTRTGRTTLYDRNPLVVAIAKMRAGSQCEVADCAHDLFIDVADQPYCEIHHINPLSEGGADEIENVVCVCPAHHREAHFGKNAQALRVSFFETRAKAR